MPSTTTGPSTRREASLVLGVDADSGLVEALLATGDGTPVGAGRSGSANPTALPIAEVVEHLETAVTRALSGTDPDEVRHVVVGAAGVLRFSRGASAATLAQVWASAGLTCPIRIVADAVTAFAAGTPARAGSVLVAGAGAIAARVDGEEVTDRIDGNGWLVGDDGSGFWIGRQAVRAVFAALDRRGEQTLLRHAVLAALTGHDDVPADLAEQVELLRGAVYDGPPIALAGLAPLVPAAAEAGDRVAQRIVDRAVTLLVDTATALAGDDPAEPLVLAGSVLGRAGLIGREVGRRLADHHGGQPLHAGSPAGGAAWLAAKRLNPNLDVAAHARLTAAA
ncbi:MAG TPA: BadF/BadG/BcrA/BcrD ATPase family protein [Planosporangium sp.]|jgi:N-acetylglucosamine kinase-like BadF-type ATPase|nr:BadF/BadG/BcrA/BcrD ATPase family protein [Planosporangium sp.]